MKNMMRDLDESVKAAESGEGEKEQQFKTLLDKTREGIQMLSEAADKQGDLAVSCLWTLLLRDYHF